MPIPVLAWLAAAAVGAAAGGGIAALMDDDEQDPDQPRSAGSPQAGTSRSDNADTAALFNQPQGPAAAQGGPAAQVGTTSDAEVAASLGVTVEEYQRYAAQAGAQFADIAAAGAAVDTDDPLVSVSPDGQPLFDPDNLSEDDIRLFEILTGKDLSTPEAALQLAKTPERILDDYFDPGTEFPRSRVSDTLFTLEDRPEQLVLLQQKLYAAGYMQGEFDDIRWGTIGPETINAFDDFLAFAARYRGADGGLVAWQTLLDRMVEASGGLRSTLEEEIEDEAPTLSVSLTDPQSIVSTLDAVWQRQTGKKAPDSQKRAFIALMHSMERDFQVQRQLGAQEPGSSTELVQPSVEGRAEALVAQEAPDETLAYQALGAYQHLLQKIGGGR